MEELEDCTEIIRMQQDFRGFADRSAKSAKRSNTFSTLNSTGPKPVPLNLDESSVLHSSSVFQSSTSSKFGKSRMSIGSIIEKENEFKMKEADLIKAKATIAELQHKVASVETSRKRQRIEMEHDIENIKQRNSATADRMEELKHQLDLALAKEEETQTLLSECRRQSSTTKAALNEKISSLHKDKIELEAAYDELQQTSRSQIMQLKNEKMRLQTEMDICQSEICETREQLEGSQRRCNELKKQIQELEEYRLKALNSDFKVKDLETTLNRMEEDAVVTKAMKTQLTRLGELERENRKLKEENSYCKNTQENVHLLREELESSKQKLVRAEIRATEAAKLQAQCEDLTHRLQKWESCSIDGANRPSSPTQLSRQISDLQHSNLLTLEKQGELQTGARALEQALQAARDELHVAKIRLTQEQHKTAQNTDFIKRLQRKLLLLKKERDGYKEILDSYESEVTVNMSGATGAARVRQLEEALQGYRNQVVHLETQLEQVTLQRDGAKAELIQVRAELEKRFTQQPGAATSEVDQKIIAGLRQQVADTEAELERITSARDVLAARIEQRHLQGDYDPMETKVIHLKVNPASVAQRQRAAEVGTLRQEVGTLQERLRLLEEEGARPDDLTVRVQENLAHPSTSHEVEEMRASLNSAELKNKRLMEAFKKKSHEFREVCFQLLGYRIDIPTDKQYHLMNIYAESPEEVLVFQHGDDGEMQLMSTDYSTTLSDKIETYLQHADSIPAFLSSVTLMLFNRQTMFQQSMVTS